MNGPGWEGVFRDVNAKMQRLSLERQLKPILINLNKAITEKNRLEAVSCAQSMAQAITIPMMFLAGIFFPIDSLPKWLANIVQYLPLAPLLRMLRDVSLDAISPLVNPMNLVIVCGWIIIALLVSIWKFRLSDE